MGRILRILGRDIFKALDVMSKRELRWHDRMLFFSICLTEKYSDPSEILTTGPGSMAFCGDISIGTNTRIRKVARRRRRRTCCSRPAQLRRRHFTLLPSTPSDVEHKSCEGVKAAFGTCLCFLIYVIVEDIFGKSARTLLLLRSRGHRLPELFADVAFTFITS